ncbi:MAG TPA: lipid-A-disaccharide synthase N-terminal domain-containing protein [Verrucomicrobiae bacterium]|nr:lipid-A-disaccharide synthase N-terminal domain-containing protein [Verrucomicrobiae bacterium]
MDWLTHFVWRDAIWHNGKFLGIDWTVWKVVGWIGNITFASRFFVQWYATEKHKKVVVPALFWWLSLTGSLVLLIYSFHKLDSVFIVAYLFPWIPYTRNLIIHYRHQKEYLECAECGKMAPPQSNFCPHCGAKLGAIAPTSQLREQPDSGSIHIVSRSAESSDASGRS